MRLHSILRTFHCRIEPSLECFRDLPERIVVWPLGRIWIGNIQIIQHFRTSVKGIQISNIKRHWVCLRALITRCWGRDAWWPNYWNPKTFRISSDLYFRKGAIWQARLVGVISKKTRFAITLVKWVGQTHSIISSGSRSFWQMWLHLSMIWTSRLQSSSNQKISKRLCQWA